ncbi:hypothetical protein ACF1BQ_031465 [Bradyrhizobium sp. RDT10]
MLAGQPFFAQSLRTAQLEIVDVSPARLFRIRSMLKEDVDAERMKAPYRLAAWPHGYRVKPN